MISAASLLDACRSIGEDEEIRARIVQALLEYERHPTRRLTRVRDEVTGPIVDALHGSAGLLRKTLTNGLTFEFRYTSKIARDFVMSTPSIPDHVWEPQTTRLCVHLAQRGGDAIVGGAYFGDQAIAVARALGQTNRCHCFEPDVVQAGLLTLNAGLNNLDNVQVDSRALWSDSGATLGFVGADAYARTVPAEAGVSTISIDDYAVVRRISQVGLIMLDLEGSEFPVLRGAEAILRRDGPPVVFEMHRAYVDWTGGLQATEVVRFLYDLGYTLFAVRDFQSNFDLSDDVIELVPIATAVTEGPAHGFNLLAVRDASILEDAIIRFTPGVSPKLLLHGDPEIHHPTGGL